MVALTAHTYPVLDPLPEHMPDNDPYLLDFDNPDAKAHEVMRAARKATGMSMAQLGDQLDPVTPWRTVYKWETGVNKPKAPRRQQVADLLGLHLPNQAPQPEGSGAEVLPITGGRDGISAAEAHILDAQIALNKAFFALAELRAAQK